MSANAPVGLCRPTILPANPLVKTESLDQPACLNPLVPCSLSLVPSTIIGMKPTDPCICGSEKPFGKCCEPFLSHKAKPKTVKQLVRSRYAAYALGGEGHREYLIRTWHPATAKNIQMADLIAEGHTWTGLEIIDFRQKGDLGRVEFKATYCVDDGPPQVHHEVSAFHRHQGTWLYLEGDIQE